MKCSVGPFDPGIDMGIAKCDGGNADMTIGKYNGGHADMTIGNCKGGYAARWNDFGLPSAMGFAHVGLTFRTRTSPEMRGNIVDGITDGECWR